MKTNREIMRPVLNEGDTIRYADTIARVISDDRSRTDKESSMRVQIGDSGSCERWSWKCDAHTCQLVSRMTDYEYAEPKVVVNRPVLLPGTVIAFNGIKAIVEKDDRNKSDDDHSILVTIECTGRTDVWKWQTTTGDRHCTIVSEVKKINPKVVVRPNDGRYITNELGEHELVIHGYNTPRSEVLERMAEARAHINEQKRKLDFLEQMLAELPE